MKPCALDFGPLDGRVCERCGLRRWPGATKRYSKCEKTSDFAAFSEPLRHNAGEAGRAGNTSTASNHLQPLEG